METQIGYNGDKWGRQVHDLAARLRRLRLQAELTNEEIAARVERQQPDLSGSDLQRAITETQKVGGVGLTQQELADRTRQYKKGGISRSMVNKIEKRRRPNPTLETLQALAQALGVLIDDLVPEETLVHTAQNVEERSNFRARMIQRIMHQVEGANDTTIQKLWEYIQFLTR
jgi:transcriptional regulator with XRE-family HTH domain